MLVKAVVVASMTWLGAVAHAGPSKSIRYVEMKTELATALPANLQFLVIRKATIDFQILQGESSLLLDASQTDSLLAQAIEGLPDDTKILVPKIYARLIQTAKYARTSGGCSQKC